MFNAIDLFCGAGGLSCGLQQADFNIALGVDINKAALITYQKNFPKTQIIEADIKNVTAEQIIEKTGILPKSNFLLAGCPPCQGFSSLGKRNPKDEKNELAFQYIRLIEELQPTFILMENVPGMSRNIGKKIFSSVIKKLREKYYLEYAILNAADYGVPQIRKRLVLHGVRKDIHMHLVSYFEKAFNLLPEQTHCDPNSRTISGYQDWCTVENSIMDLPPICAGENYTGEKKIFNHQARNLSELNKTRLAIIQDNTGSRDSLPDNYVLNCHKNTKTYSDTYGTMDLKKPAPTLTSGCTCISKGRYGHPTQKRGISLREAARLQSFPDDFIFYGNISSISLQIGNAVPPNLAKASAQKIYSLMTIVEALKVI